MQSDAFITPAFAQRRYPSLDVARGLIMIVMALDHSSAFWNAHRPFLEGVPGMPIEYAGWMQQLTREVTHICAPGFQLLAGMGLAISVVRRQKRGVSEWVISGDMILRGIVLCLCDFVLMYFAYGMIPFFFIVLACIGSCIIIFSVLRKLPLAAIGALGAAVLFAAPFYAPTAVVMPSVAAYPVNVLHNISLPFAEGATMAFWVLYPIFPWFACFAIGWYLGTVYELRPEGRFAGLATMGLLMLAAAFLLRWFAGNYADRLPTGDGPGSSSFWALSKYPPSPAFLLVTLGVLFVMLGVLRPLDARDRVGGVWRLAMVYGRVSLFFYIVHMYVFLSYPQATGTEKSYSLGTVYVVWLAGLLVMLPLCLLYHRARLRWPRVLRYL